ncbi:SPOR domain-containing protein, partial [Acidithiobacillus caldus]|nr:SPOR domain-containing protein [Acidithiobacillus caldus]
MTGVARPPLLAMRDYKGHSSRPSASPPPPRPIPPRDEEEESSAPAPRRRWPWLLILLVLLLSGASWWWLAQLPLDRGQLGLLKAPQKPVAATTSDRVQGPVAAAAVSAAAPVQSPLAS